jgi:hypothetical protein
MGQIKEGPYQKAFVRKTDDGWVLEVLGAPYGGHRFGKDEDGEYFSENTDFMLNVGDKRPVLYYHGADDAGKPTPRPEVIGTATATRRDSQGLWFEVALDKAKEFSRRIYDAALNGLARASSGAINYLVRKREDGELITWPIGELTLIDRSDMRRPANELAVAYLKAAFIQSELEFPEAFLESGELKRSAADEETADNQYLIKKEVRTWQKKKRSLPKR